MREQIHHINEFGFVEKIESLEMALDVFIHYKKKLKVTGRDTGATCEEFGKYIMNTLQDPKLEEKWNSYQNN